MDDHQGTIIASYRITHDFKGGNETGLRGALTKGSPKVTHQSAKSDSQIWDKMAAS